MTTVTHKGKTVHLKGELPAEGQKGPDFTFVDPELSEVRLTEIGEKIKILIAVPSLDTSVCAAETFNFSQKLAQKDGVAALEISKDLPFAMKRYMQNNHITNIIAASDFRYGEFTTKYNVEMTDGPLKGLTSRAIFVLDKDDIIKYVELVPEISLEPQYSKALAIIDSLL